MLTGLLVVLMAIVTLAYVFSIFVGNVLVYVITWQVLLATACFGLMVLIAKVTWHILPEDIKKVYGRKRSAFELVIVINVIFFIIVSKTIHHLILPDAFGSVRFLGDVVIFTFAVFFIWSRIKRRWKTLVIASSAAVLLVVFLYFSKSFTFKEHIDKTRERSTDNLPSLPYLDWVPLEKADEKTGVVRYDKDLCFNGFNLYPSAYKPEAYLIDLHGNIVHKWSEASKAGGRIWEYVELCPNGDLLVAVLDSMLVRLDWDSNIKWLQEMRAHHHITIDEAGTIYTLARDDNVVTCKGIPFPIADDFVAVVSPEGKLIKKLYLYEVAKKFFTYSNVVNSYRGNWRDDDLIERVYRGDRTAGFLQPWGLMKIIMQRMILGWSCAQDSPFDVLHANTIEVLNRDIDGFCKNGDWLVSIRQLDLIGVINPNEGKFVWTWGPGELDKQHSPSLLENGNLLIFGNGPHRGYSRVIELNPISKQIEWQYKAKPPESFYSFICGLCQRLPNGNTLITESMKGRVFEVTKEGKIVWEFYSHKLGPDSLVREPIRRMVRIVDLETVQEIERRIKGISY